MTSVLAIPTPDSKKRLQNIFLSSPVAVDFDRIAIRLAPDASMAEGTGMQYEGRFIWFGQKYHDETAVTELIGTIYCPEMAKRRMELTGVMSEDNTVDLVFQSPATLFSSFNKYFLVSVHDTLVTKEKVPFTFTEVIV